MNIIQFTFALSLSLSPVRLYDCDVVFEGLGVVPLVHGDVLDAVVGVGGLALLEEVVLAHPKADVLLLEAVKEKIKVVVFCVLFSSSSSRLGEFLEHQVGNRDLPPLRKTF